MFRYFAFTTFLAASLLLVFCHVSSGHVLNDDDTEANHEHNVVRKHYHSICVNESGSATKTVSHSHEVEFAIDYTGYSIVCGHYHPVGDPDRIPCQDASPVATQPPESTEPLEPERSTDGEVSGQTGNSGESVTPDSGDTGGSTVTQPNPPPQQPAQHQSGNTGRQSEPSGQSEPAQTHPPASDEQVVIVSVNTSPQMPAETEVLEPIKITEYMIRDWSNAGGGGLPQWIELYNPNPDPVNLDGYTFQYATRNAANDPFEIKSVSISEATIAPESTLIFVTRKIPLPLGSTIQESQIYNLKIDNVLKRGWKIITPDDIVIHQIGQAFGDYTDPIAPLHQDGARVSHHVQKSVDPTDSYYYGSWADIGSPGFHEPLIPSAPALIRPKKVGVWADLKRRVK